MKLITPLFSDPIGWAEFVAKTPTRIILAIFVHIGFIYWGFRQTARIINIQSSHDISAIDLMLTNFPIMFIGIVDPALYFIAMHLLLRIMRKKKTEPEGRLYGDPRTILRATSSPPKVTQ